MTESIANFGTIKRKSMDFTAEQTNIFSPLKDQSVVHPDNNQSGSNSNLPKDSIIQLLRQELHAARVNLVQVGLPYPEHFQDISSGSFYSQNMQ